MRGKLQGTFDLTAPMPKLSEDDVKTQKILMQEMLEHPDPEAAERLELYKNEMRKAKALIRHFNSRDEQ